MGRCQRRPVCQRPVPAQCQRRCHAGPDLRARSARQGERAGKRHHRPAVQVPRHGAGDPGQRRAVRRAHPRQPGAVGRESRVRQRERRIGRQLEPGQHGQRDQSRHPGHRDRHRHSGRRPSGDRDHGGPEQHLDQQERPGVHEHRLVHLQQDQRRQLDTGHRRRGHHRQHDRGRTGPRHREGRELRVAGRQGRRRSGRGRRRAAVHRHGHEQRHRAGLRRRRDRCHAVEPVAGGRLGDGIDQRGRGQRLRGAAHRAAERRAGMGRAERRRPARHPGRRNAGAELSGHGDVGQRHADRQQRLCGLGIAQRRRRGRAQRCRLPQRDRAEHLLRGTGHIDGGRPSIPRRSPRRSAQTPGRPHPVPPATRRCASGTPFSTRSPPRCGRARRRTS